MRKFITTPIFYVNGSPHIGHAYTSVIADVIARFWRSKGYNVHFSTGTDEHGIKVAQKAESLGMSAHELCDVNSAKFSEMSAMMNVSYDDFIRTTQDRHKKAAQRLWEMIAHDIYIDEYKGLYSVSDEMFVREEDTVDGEMPHGGEVIWLSEECYFFRLSKYRERLIEYIASHDVILPVSRRNEILSFLQEEVRDLAISRTRFSWGVPVPGANNHVMYVWIDALVNYLTTLGFPENMERVREFMPECVHIIGKEILRFHAVYWLAFLMSADLPLPKTIFAHGWWLHDGNKMSKTRNNFVVTEELVDLYGVDAVRYFLAREVRFGEDGDYSDEAMAKRYRYDLANDLGNLVQRTLMFAYKRGAFVPNYDEFTADDQQMLSAAKSLDITSFMENFQIHLALEEIFKLVRLANQYVENHKPWVLAKNGDESRLNAVLTVLFEAIRYTAYALYPFMPTVSSKICGFLQVTLGSEKLFEKMTMGCPEVLFPVQK